MIDTLGRVTIGAPKRGNVIAGNAQDGVQVSGSSAVIVQSNFIGTNAAGDTAVPNGARGVGAIGSEGLRIGGRSAEHANVIAGNGGHGIEIDAAGLVVRPQITFNVIGLDASALSGLGNAGDGSA